MIRGYCSGSKNSLKVDILKGKEEIEYNGWLRKKTLKTIEKVNIGEIFYIFT